MRIKQPVEVKGKWHVAVMNPHERQDGGTVLIPIACWMIVTDADGDDHVTPFVVAPDGDDGNLMPASAFDAEDFLGIVPPGEETRTWWGEMADERLKEEQAGDNRRELSEKAERVAARLIDDAGANVPDLRRLLKKFNETHLAQVAAPEYSFEQSQFYELANLGLITPHDGSSRDVSVRWYATELGKSVHARIKDVPLPMTTSADLNPPPRAPDPDPDPPF